MCSRGSGSARRRLMGPGCRNLRGLGRRRVMPDGIWRGLAVDTRLDERVDMPWELDMLFQACIRGMMGVKRSSFQDHILALLPQGEKTLYRGFDSVFRTVRYDSQLKGQSRLAHSQSYPA